MEKNRMSVSKIKTEEEISVITGTTTAINAIVNIVPAVILLISLIPLCKYKLDKATMQKISAELAERRGN